MDQKNRELLELIRVSRDFMLEAALVACPHDRFADEWSATWALYKKIKKLLRKAKARRAKAKKRRKNRRKDRTARK